MALSTHLSGSRPRVAPDLNARLRGPEGRTLMGYEGLGVAPTPNEVGTISGSQTDVKTLRPPDDCCSKSKAGLLSF